MTLEFARFRPSKNKALSKRLLCICIPPARLLLQDGPKTSKNIHFLGEDLTKIGINSGNDLTISALFDVWPAKTSLFASKLSKRRYKKCEKGELDEEKVGRIGAGNFMYEIWVAKVL